MGVGGGGFGGSGEGGGDGSDNEGGVGGISEAIGEGGVAVKTIGDGVVPTFEEPSACMRPIVMPNTMPKATQTIKVMNMMA